MSNRMALNRGFGSFVITHIHMNSALGVVKFSLNENYLLASRDALKVGRDHQEWSRRRHALRTGMHGFLVEMPVGQFASLGQRQIVTI